MLKLFRTLKRQHAIFKLRRKLQTHFKPVLKPLQVARKVDLVDAKVFVYDTLPTPIKLFILKQLHCCYNWCCGAQKPNCQGYSRRDCKSRRDFGSRQHRSSRQYFGSGRDQGRSIWRHFGTRREERRGDTERPTHLSAADGSLLGSDSSIIYSILQQVYSSKLAG